MSLVDSLLLPFTSDGLFVEMLWRFGLYLLIAVSLDLVMGYTGMFQLGHIGFFALGAIGTTFATHPDYMALDMFSGILFGFGLTTLATLLVGVPTLRLTGDYFAIATFGFTLSVQAVLKGYWATGIFGVPGMNPFGCDPTCMAETGWGHVVGSFVAWVLGIEALNNATEVGIELAFLFVILVLVYVFLGRMKSAPLGRTLKSIREDRHAAMSLGKNTQLLRFKALWVSALVASLAGSLWVHHSRTMGPGFYGFQLLILTLIAVILGGLGSHFGALLGAALFVLLDVESVMVAQWIGQTFPEETAGFSLPAFRLILFGGLLVVLMVMRPQGIMGDREVSLRSMWTRWRRRHGGRPETKEGSVGDR